MQITDESVFTMNRRDILKILGITVGASLIPDILTAKETAQQTANTAVEAFTGYNNFYEFGMGKLDPGRRAQQFDTTNWTVDIKGMVKKPTTLSMAEMHTLFGDEERIYRLRCVEAWAMVVPWKGFALHKLLQHVGVQDGAKYVVFTSAADPKQMPEVKRQSFPFPYVEGLRLDEAMHPLSFLATGAYGKALLPQNGAPIRLVVPWKYGFKYAKSLATITLTDKEPDTTWTTYSAEEYGFYANVNPDVPHPRWPQSEENIFGPKGVNDSVRQPTLMFNGYSEVASLYAGMDLVKNY